MGITTGVRPSDPLGGYSGSSDSSFGGGTTSEPSDGLTADNVGSGVGSTTKIVEQLLHLIEDVLKLLASKLGGSQGGDQAGPGGPGASENGGGNGNALGGGNGSGGGSGGGLGEGGGTGSGTGTGNGLGDGSGSGLGGGSGGNSGSGAGSTLGGGVGDGTHGGSTADARAASSERASAASATSKSDGTGASADARVAVSTAETKLQGLYDPSARVAAPIPINEGGAGQALSAEGKLGPEDANKIALDGPLKGLKWGQEATAAAKANGLDPKLVYGDSIVESGSNKLNSVILNNRPNDASTGGPLSLANGVWDIPSSVQGQFDKGAQVINHYIQVAHGDVAKGLNGYNTGDVNNGGYADGFATYADGVQNAVNNVAKFEASQGNA